MHIGKERGTAVTAKTTCSTMKAGVIAVVVAVAVALLGCCHVCLAEVDYYEVRRMVVEIASSGVCVVCELTDSPLVLAHMDRCLVWLVMQTLARSRRHTGSCH